jgi:protein TonB
MDMGRWIAAAGAIALNALALGAALTLVGPQGLHPLIRPVEVRLIRPPEPPTPPEPLKVEPTRPPEPLPVAKTPPRRATPARPPPAPVVAARPIDEPRPAAITAEAAPPTAPVAPRVTEGVAAAPVAAAPATHDASPVRVGPRVDASWAGNAPPPYPAMARRLGEEGEVRLDVHVGVDGNVIEVRLKKSSGSHLLDQTAIETVKKWRFKPATVDGRPVAEWYYNWKWVFKLES